MDRALAVLGDTSSGWFHLVVDLDGEPDLEALGEAWRRLVSRHPILRATARFDQEPAAWELSPSIPGLQVVDEADERVECTDPDRPVEVVVPGAIELGILRDDPTVAAGPLARLTLLRRPSGPRLVASTHHVVCDAASGMTLFEELVGHHRSVRAGRPGPDDVDGRPRVVEDLLVSGRLSPTARAAAVSRLGARWWSLERSTHVDPDAPGDHAGYAAVEVGEALAAVEEVRRRRRWRTSAILLALLARGWERAFPGSGSGVRSGWQLSTDLRRELGLEGGLGNFSSTEPVVLHDVAERPVEEVVREAQRLVTGLSSTWPGLAVPEVVSGVAVPWSVFAATADAALDNVAGRRCTRSFSNVGRTSLEATQWGDAEVRRIFYAPAMTTMPWVTIAAQGLGPRTWVSMRTHERGVDAAGVGRLGAAMLADAVRLAEDVQLAETGSSRRR